jgi:hypothetical protein
MSDPVQAWKDYKPTTDPRPAEALCVSLCAEVGRWRAEAQGYRCRFEAEVVERRNHAIRVDRLEAELAEARALIRAVADTPMSLDVLDSPVMRRVGAYVAAHPEERE